MQIKTFSVAQFRRQIRPRHYHRQGRRREPPANQRVEGAAPARRHHPEHDGRVRRRHLLLSRDLRSVGGRVLYQRHLERGLHSARGNEKPSTIVVSQINFDLLGREWKPVIVMADHAEPCQLGR